MIENFRKYTGLIMVVVVLVFIGLVFFFDSGFLSQGAGGGGTAIRVDGTSYSQMDYTNLGAAPMQLLQDLPRSEFSGFDPNGLELMRFGGLLAGGAQSESAAVENFFTGRMVLRDAAKRYGVHPSDTEVADFIANLSGFQARPDPAAAPGTPGLFDQAKYNDFIQKFIGRYGLSEKDFQALIRDVIATSKLREVIARGLPASRELASALAIVNSQQVQVQVSTIELDSFKESIKPGDEELKEYWEITKDAFTTEKRIKVSYFIAAPEKPAAEEGTEEKPEDSRAADKVLAQKVDDFLTQLGQSEGEAFDSLIASNGWEKVATDWFTRSTLPEALKIAPRSSSAGKQVVDHLFGLSTGPDALAPFTSAIAVGKNEWLVARLDDLEESRTKTFDEARDEVLKRYIDEKADAALKEEVAAKVSQIREALAVGKTFAEAAKEVGLELQPFGPFAVSDQPDGLSNPQEVFNAASTVNAGELAEPLYPEGRAMLVFVDKRQIVKDDNRGQQIDGYVTNLSSQIENSAFSAWLMNRMAEARVERGAL